MIKLESLDIRSSKQQLKDEVENLHAQMTDPKKIDERKRKDKIAKKIKDQVEDFGL